MKEMFENDCFLGWRGDIKNLKDYTDEKDS